MRYVFHHPTSIRFDFSCSMEDKLYIISCVAINNFVAASLSLTRSTLHIVQQLVVLPSSDFTMASTPDYTSRYLKMHNDANTEKFNMISGTFMLILCATLAYVLWKTAPKKKKALDPENWVEMPLRKIEEVSHDVKKFRFFFETPLHILGLPIGQHISLKFIDAEGKEVQRSYTPITSDVDSGYVEFMIKVYFKNVNERFPLGKIELTSHSTAQKLSQKAFFSQSKFAFSRRQDESAFE